MRQLMVAFGILLLLNGAAVSQCSTLTVSGSFNPGQTIGLSVTGATPNAFAYVLAGEPGVTTISFGSLGSLTVALSQPFEILPIGMTNGSGNLSFSIPIGSNYPQALIPNKALTIQVVTLHIGSSSPPLSFCVSNADDLILGDGGALAAVRRWNQIAIDASGFDHATAAAQPGPGRSSRAMAIIHVATFEALLAIDGGYQSYLGLAHVSPPVSRPAAIAKAAHDTLVALFPAQTGAFDASLASDLALVSSNAAKASGVALGSASAAAILALRTGDGSEVPEPLVNTEFTCSDQPGFWRQDPISLHPLALGAHWGAVTPFVLNTQAQFRAPAPPAMTSAEYATAYDEAKAVGGDNITTLSTRTPEQTIQAIYWAYDGTPSLCAPPRLYNQIAILIGNQQGLNAIQLGRLLAVVNVALADAGIACWESKFFYQLWRPIAGIRESDPGMGPTGLGDGNPATVADQAWTPLGAPASNTMGPNFTPPFPTYPSGHATFGGTLFQVMRRFFGTNDIAFTFVSDEFNGVTLDNQGHPRPYLPRSFPNFSVPEEENGQSRIYLGIHWSYDKTAGISQGNSVANWVFDHLYQPIP